MNLQWDKYLHEVEKASTSLTGVENVLLSLNLGGSLYDQVTRMVKVVAKKNKALTSFQGSLAFAQREL